MVDANCSEISGARSEATREQIHHGVDIDVRSLTIGDQAALARRWTYLPMQCRVTPLF